MPDTDYDDLLEGASDYSDNPDPLSEVLDSVHLGAPVTAKLEDETKSLTDAEIEAQTDNLDVTDLEAGIAKRTPALRDLLEATDESE